MKKLFFAIIFLISPITSFAAGPFDGVYSLSIPGESNSFVSIHENNNNEIVAIVIEPVPNDATWEALVGIRTNNSVQLNSVLGTVVLQASIVFNDDQTASVTIISCVPDTEICEIPNNTTLNMTKIF